MTAAPEKAAPIPAEDASGVDIQRLADRCAQSVYSSIGKRDITRPIKEAIVDAILADRASQEERIREDEREACATVAECAFDDRPRLPDNIDWTDGYRAGTRDAAQAIRARARQGGNNG